MRVKADWFPLMFAAIFLFWGTISGTGAEIKLEFVPMPEVDKPDYTLIHFKGNDISSVHKWRNIIDRFIDQYRRRDSTVHANVMYCSYTLGPAGEKVCDVSIRDFGHCTSENNYNYHRSAPCIFLKLNNILNWIPEPYNSTEGLPENMPQDLKDHIASISGQPEANQVWVSCDGETPTDKEKIGQLQYIPQRGFPTYYFPFTNQLGYFNPLVAVNFQRPATEILINVECRAWAKNIGNCTVHFELMVD